MSEDTPKVMDYLEKEEVPAGHVLIADGRTARLLTLGAGTAVGQEELYLGSSRTASVIAETPSVVYRLSAGALHRMESDEPRLAIALHHLLARVLTQRLAAIHRTLQGLMQ